MKRILTSFEISTTLFQLNNYKLLRTVKVTLARTENKAPTKLHKTINIYDADTQSEHELFPLP